MRLVCWLVLLSAAWPLWRAWRSNRRTSLQHTLLWAGAAWLAWVWAIYPDSSEAFASIRWYLALSLSACAIIGVLGARQPGMAAWNFVLAGLLALLLVPVAEALATDGDLSLGEVRTLFLAAALAVGLVTYLPTRLALPMVVFYLGCAGGIATLATNEHLIDTPVSLASVSRWCVALAPWIAFVLLRWRPRPASTFDAAWLDFRDRYGLFWSQRVREQFNAAAGNAGQEFELGWGGLRSAGAVRHSGEKSPTELLRALLKRFNAKDEGSTERGTVTDR